ncbi:MAG: hypothetical protein KGQ49_02985 [Verrucomicrobia bacterium]|nr:hypothetical protein [Verrucomicrobiota bacterium]
MLGPGFPSEFKRASEDFSAEGLKITPETKQVGAWSVGRFTLVPQTRVEKPNNTPITELRLNFIASDKDGQPCMIVLRQKSHFSPSNKEEVQYEEEEVQYCINRETIKLLSDLFKIRVKASVKPDLDTVMKVEDLVRRIYGPEGVYPIVS